MGEEFGIIYLYQKAPNDIEDINRVIQQKV